MKSIMKRLNCFSCLRRDCCDEKEAVDEKGTYARTVEVSEKQQVRIATYPTRRARRAAPPPPPRPEFQPEAENPFRDPVPALANESCPIQESNSIDVAFPRPTR
jgi:hypothetical protein